MKTKAIKIAVTCVVLAAALGGLMYTTLQGGTEYYIHVDEVMQNPSLIMPMDRQVDDDLALRREAERSASRAKNRRSVC